MTLLLQSWTYDSSISDLWLPNRAWLLSPSICYLSLLVYPGFLINTHFNKTFNLAKNLTSKLSTSGKLSICSGAGPLAARTKNTVPEPLFIKQIWICVPFSDHWDSHIACSPQVTVCVVFDFLVQHPSFCCNLQHCTSPLNTVVFYTSILHISRHPFSLWVLFADVVETCSCSPAVLLWPVWDFTMLL